MAWMVPIHLVWVLVHDLQDVNRVASLAVHFPPSTEAHSFNAFWSWFSRSLSFIFCAYGAMGAYFGSRAGQ